MRALAATAYRTRRRGVALVLGLLSLCCCTALLGVDKDYLLVDTVSDAAPDAPDATSDGIAPSDSDSALDAGADADGNGCPSGRGPNMVRADSGCIDSTEVTVKQYRAFLEAGADGALDLCTWNTTFVPSGWPPPPGTDDYPVGSVDWCDAYAYCLWAGKRLCGRIGGGASTPVEAVQAQFNQWYATCSSGGVNLYPYGQTYDASACNGLGRTMTPGVIAVGALPTCQSMPGVYDMSGNASEWTDTCETGLGASDVCISRGGNAGSGDINLTCTRQARMVRSAVEHNVGFRCCAN